MIILPFWYSHPAFSTTAYSMIYRTICNLVVGVAEFAWVTLATNDSYSMGALVLAHSLRQVNTVHQLVILITPGVTEAMK